MHWFMPLFGFIRQSFSYDQFTLWLNYSCRLKKYPYLLLWRYISLFHHFIRDMALKISVSCSSLFLLEIPNFMQVSIVLL